MHKLALIIVLISTNLLCSTSYIKAAELDLPDIGDSAAAVMTPAQEQRTGEAVVRNLRRAGLIIDDPLLNDYLNQLGYRLLSHNSSNHQTRFHFFLINDKNINAFALPGGYIGINYGLFLASESESELASVVAHEIAHVTQRHYARAYDIGSKNELPMLAAIIAAIILASQGGEMGEAAIATVAGASARSQINFTRQNEEEADRIGISMLARAGFDPEKMANFFEKLDKESRGYGIEIPEFLRTHPVNTSRIADARSRAHQLTPAEPKDDTTYRLMRHRIQALASSEKQRTTEQYRYDLQKAGSDSATRYGYALSLIRQEKYSEAEKEIDRLLAAEPHRIAFLLAKADIDAKAGRTAQALATYQKALGVYPHNSAITYDYVNLLLKQSRYEKAERVLTQYLKTPAENPDFYRFLAQARAKRNNQTGSHEAMAEYYYQIGQFHQAIEQIELALKDSRADFYTTSRLEARLALIKEEIPKNQN